MITGLAVGCSRWCSAAVPGGHHLRLDDLAGLYGVGIAAVGMLATVGITMAIDAYGRWRTTPAVSPRWPVWARTRQITDGLDELGNTTARHRQGLCHRRGGARGAGDHQRPLSKRCGPQSGFQLEINDPWFWSGCSSAARPVPGRRDHHDRVWGRGIRYDQRDPPAVPGNPRLLEGKAEPDYGQVHRHRHPAALKRMCSRAIAVLAPPVGRSRCWPEPGRHAGRCLLGCVLMALMMANAGGAWDNAKKYVEKGNSAARAPTPTRRRCRRHVWRPVQGHLGPVDEHPHQRDGDRQPGDRAAALIAVGISAEGPERRSGPFAFHAWGICETAGVAALQQAADLRIGRGTFRQDE